jgi:hypothetical protein
MAGPAVATLNFSYSEIRPRSSSAAQSSCPSTGIGMTGQFTSSRVLTLKLTLFVSSLRSPIPSSTSTSFVLFASKGRSCLVFGPEAKKAFQLQRVFGNSEHVGLVKGGQSGTRPLAPFRRRANLQAAKRVPTSPVCADAQCSEIVSSEPSHVRCRNAHGIRLATQSACFL